jgi:predicted nuclease with TOPRIM domain
MAQQTSKRLAAILEELHRVLESARDLDDEAREALRAAAADIRQALDEGSGAASQLDALRTRIERFEGEHPRLTEAVRRLVDQLAEMGI